MSTSRAPLGVVGEVVWTVPPLDAAAATELFRERTGLNEDNRDAIAAICAAVDRLPLGIELAAAAARRLPLDRIADALAPMPDLAETTASARQRSLDAAVARSFQLLDRYAQELLRRLAVFEGGWTLEAAEVVAAGDGLDRSTIPADLSRLVAASLVTFDPASRRYAMLDTIHAFARARRRRPDRLIAHINGTWCGPSTWPQATDPSLSARTRPRRAAAAAGLPKSSDGAALGARLGSPRRGASLGLWPRELWAVTDSGAEGISYLRRVLANPGPPTVERVELTVARSGMPRRWAIRTATRRKPPSRLRWRENFKILGPCAEGRSRTASSGRGPRGRRRPQRPARAVTPSTSSPSARHMTWPHCSPKLSGGRCQCHHWGYVSRAGSRCATPTTRRP